jgi:HSP20 family molecular chaperone IbpA
MATPQELAVRDKKELVSKEEKTVPGRYYVPYGDIYETDEALTVVLEMPGVEKKDLDVALENGILRVDGRIDFAKYDGMEPLYTNTTSATIRGRSLYPTRSTRSISAPSSTMAC